MITSIGVIGDSCSVGFGTHGRSYPVLLSEQLGASHLELRTEFGKTTKVALEADAEPMVALCPDLIVVQTGVADSLLHPGQRVQGWLERFAPATWHGIDGLEARAVFDRNQWRRSRQRVASVAKTTLKGVLVRVSGFTRMEPADYGACLEQLLTRLEAAVPVVVSVGFFTVDERFFPRQHQARAPFIAARLAVLERHPGVVAVEPDEVLRQWDHYLGDHGHWNAAGHAQVAALIARRVHEVRPEMGGVAIQPGRI